MFNRALAKSLRKQKGLNQTQLAELCEVHPVTISNWERGEKLPETKNIQALAHALGVTTDELMTAPSEDKKSAPAGMAANGGDNYGIQLNNSENNGTISQGVIMGASASASDTVDADLEAALRLRHERPEIIKLLADKDFTAAQIRALASAPRDEKDKD